MHRLDKAEFGFTNDKLLIGAGRREIQIAWRPEPLARERSASGRWTDFFPDFRLVAPVGEDCGPADGKGDGMAAKQEVFEAFRATVPDDITRRAVMFSTHQWMFMRLCAYDGQFAELSDSNPILAWCLANNFEFRALRPGVAFEQALYYARRKQKYILQWLGFPGSPATVRLFNKIRRDASLLSSLLLLRAALRQNADRMKLLSHHDVITGDMIGLLNPRLAAYVTPALIEDAAGQPADARPESASDLLLDVLYLSDNIRARLPARKFMSFQKLLEYRDELLLRFEAQRAQIFAAPVRSNIFPDPPIPGNEHIVPIRTKNELANEGRKQCNCVRSYANRVLDGNCYVYRVLWPERATLSLARMGYGTWIISELKAYHNNSVTGQTTAEVRKWMEQHSMGI